MFAILKNWSRSRQEKFRKSCIT